MRNIIISNKIKIGRLPGVNYSTPEKAICHLTKLKAFQDAKAEQEGNLIESNEMNPFVQAVHLAYSFHLPLVITPDIIWHLISSQIAIHINKNAEKLREKFVNHEGKEKIRIVRNDFVLNGKNPWHEVIDEFSVEIEKRTKTEVADIIQANFTTTTKISRTVSQVVLMDSMQAYFEYILVTKCGIPEIRLDGEKQDWINVKTKTVKIIEIIPELQIWMSRLEEVLDNFIKAFDGEVNKSFWNQIYKSESMGSGNTYITGWITVLFLYINADNHKNPYAWESSWKNSLKGLTSEAFTSQLSKAPFIWEYSDEQIEMAFLGGLIGILHRQDQSLLPIFGYAITEDNEQLKDK